MSTQRCDPAVDLPRPPVPGDLYLDPDVPAAQRVRVGQGRWRAEATHVWTGTGWTRVVAGEVRLVPSAGPAHSGAVRSAPVLVTEPRPAAPDQASVHELRPLTPSSRASRPRRRSRYAALEHRWAS